MDRMIGWVLGCWSVGVLGCAAASLASPAAAADAQQAPSPAPAPLTAADLARVPDFGEVTLDGIVFVKIPAGQFVMGTTDSQRAELQAADEWTSEQEDERPAHPVTITRPFLIDKYEVTQKQWAAVMAKDPPKMKLRARDTLRDPSAFKGADLPEESVSWADVQLFLEKLNADGGPKYRLPTEAEWEYCARAGGDGLYGLGAARAPIAAADLAEYAWFRANAGSRTQTTGSRKPNAWGLHDMLGNVWEWCQDTYDPGYYAHSPAADPVNRSEGTERVFRGGSWFLEPQQLRCTFRGANLPTFRSQYVGFRLVWELATDPSPSPK